MIQDNKHQYEIIVQKVCLITMVLLMMPLLFMASRRFYITDPQPIIHYLIPKEMSANNPPVKVQTGLSISSFSTFDPMHDAFVLNGIVWFEFNPQEISLDTIDKFSFFNGEILTKVPLDTNITHDTLRVSYAISAKISTQLGFHFFPLEDHNIFFILTNKYVSPNEVEYKTRSTDFIMSKHALSLGEWKVVDTAVDYGYAGHELQASPLDTNIKHREMTNPQALFFMKIEKNNMGDTSTFLLPLMVLFILTILMLSYGDTVKNCLSIIGALIGYKFVASSMAPKVSYFTLIDYLYTLAFCISFLVLCIGLFREWTNITSPILKWIALLSIPFFCGLWIAIWVWLVFFV
jgi:hypothetical protein